MSEPSVEIKINQGEAGRDFQYWNYVAIQPFQALPSVKTVYIKLTCFERPDKERS